MREFKVGWDPDSGTEGQGWGLFLERWGVVDERGDGWRGGERDSDSHLHISEGLVRIMFAAGVEGGGGALSGDTSRLHAGV